MSATAKSHSDLTQLQDDVAALKRDLTGLIADMKKGAANGAHRVAKQVDDEATRLYRSLAAEGERSVKLIEQQIEEQPLVALLIALGLGYIGGRLLSR